MGRHCLLFGYYGEAKATLGFCGGSAVKNLPVNAGDAGSIPELGRSSEENGNLIQYSCLGNAMDRGAWQATVHGVAKESDTNSQLNNNKSLLCSGNFLFS